MDRAVGQAHASSGGHHDPFAEAGLSFAGRIRYPGRLLVAGDGPERHEGVAPVASAISVRRAHPAHRRRIPKRFGCAAVVLTRSHCSCVVKYDAFDIDRSLDCTLAPIARGNAWADLPTCHVPERESVLGYRVDDLRVIERGPYTDRKGVLRDGGHRRRFVDAMTCH